MSHGGNVALTGMAVQALPLWRLLTIGPQKCQGMRIPQGPLTLQLAWLLHLRLLLGLPSALLSSDLFTTTHFLCPEEAHCDLNREICVYWKFGATSCSLNCFIPQTYNL